MPGRQQLAACIQPALQLDQRVCRRLQRRRGAAVGSRRGRVACRAQGAGGAAAAPGAWRAAVAKRAQDAGRQPSKGGGQSRRRGLQLRLRAGAAAARAGGKQVGAWCDLAPADVRALAARHTPMQPTNPAAAPASSRRLTSRSGGSGQAPTPGTSECIPSYTPVSTTAAEPTAAAASASDAKAAAVSGQGRKSSSCRWVGAARWEERHPWAE